MTMDSSGLLRSRTAEGAAVQLAAYLVKNPPTPDDPRAAEHRVALESLNIVANTLALAVPVAPSAAPSAAPAPPPPARANEQAGGSRYDARDDITQRRVNKRWQQRAARVGFEHEDSDEDAPDGENRGAECFHYKIREAMPPRRFKPSPSDADKYDGTQEPQAWIEDYLQNVIAHKGNQIAAMQCF